ncbi:MAG: WbqC family protein [Kofleriaceae bacterium]|nr:WbqC family protein [Kofleriaceae bacterium]
MIVAAHQPHYMPWLGYLDKLAKADLFVVMDDLQFIGRNYQNRQQLKLAEGPAWLTVPIVRGHSDRILDKQIEACGNPKQHWQHRHWRTLVSHYGAARYFSHYADELLDVYTRPWTNLIDLDLHMLALARRWLDIPTPVVRASKLDLTGAKTDRLIDLCQKVGARCYLTGVGGSSDYLDVEKVGRAGIGVVWQEFTHPEYPQRYPAAGFKPRLGFLDLVLNCGPASRDILFDTAHPVRAAGFDATLLDPSKAPSRDAKRVAAPPPRSPEVVPVPLQP